MCSLFYNPVSSSSDPHKTGLELVEFTRLLARYGGLANNLIFKFKMTYTKKNLLVNLVANVHYINL